MKNIGHFVGGSSVAGTSGTYGPIFDPATGEQTGRVAYADAAEVDKVVQVALAALPAWSATPIVRRMRVMFKLKELVERNLDRLALAVTAEHGKTLERRQGLGHPRARGGRVRLRHPAAAEGRVQPTMSAPASTRVRAPAARRVRRHHAVQLPGHGADVDVAGGHRLRQHLHPEAVGEGSVLPACCSPSCSTRRACPTACSTSSTATRTPSTRCCTIPTSPAISFVGSTADRPSTSTGPAPRTASASRRWAGPRTTWSSCPTPTWTRRSTR